jgi:3-dehydroquinate dehydratase
LSQGLAMQVLPQRNEGNEIYCVLQNNFSEQQRFDVETQISRVARKSSFRRHCMTATLYFAEAFGNEILCL